MSPIEVAVRVVIDLLERGQFAVLEQLTSGRRLSGDAMAAALAEYGRTLTSPGPEWWSLVVVTPIHERGGQRLHVAAPLWTVEEGRSDLTVEMTLTPSSFQTFDTELLDIHVL
jgi:hypothetical protein